MRKIMVLVLLVFTSAASASNDCIFHLKLNDDTNSTTVVDSQGYSNGTFNDTDGDPNTDAHSTVGKINTALDFDGTDDYVATNDAFESTFQDSFSINIWFKTPYSSLDKTLWVCGDDAENNMVYVLIRVKEFVSSYIFFEIETTSNAMIIKNYSDISINEWYMLTVIAEQINSTQVKASVFLNANLLETSTENLNLSTYSNSDTAVIGATKSLGSVYYYHVGSLDNVMIFNKALTTDEVQRLYNSGSGTEIPADIEENRTRRSGNSPLPLRDRY